MAKNTVQSWDTNPTNNTDIGGVNISEGCDAAGINNAIRELMAQLATWLNAPEFRGGILLSGPYPQIEFNSGGPRLRSPAANSLAFHSDANNAVERMLLSPDGSWSVWGAFPNAGALPGSGNFRVASRIDGGLYYSLTTFSFFNYKPLQAVRQVSGVNEQRGYIATTDGGTEYNETGAP